MTSAVAGDVRRICINLIPYFIFVGLYFILLIPYESPSYWAVIIKCAPIISLMHFVVRIGFKNGYNAYSSRILSGLIFSCIGDALLLWNRTFVHGMLAFIIGHINYIWAFGLIPLKLKTGLFLLSLGGIVVSALYPGLKGELAVGVPIYILVINAMVWRATARIQRPCTWVQLATCIGSVLFAMSDLTIGVDRFIKPIAHSQVLIMSSYYAAQLGVSLSVTEC